MGDYAEVHPDVLTHAVAALTERRISVERAVNALGEAPSGLKDVFELCRGFERAFQSIVNDSPAASKIKEAFFSERGLAGKIEKLPLEKVFDLDGTKKICRTADGYQPHLVSPEKGMRSLASEALSMVENPVKETIQEVYSLLIAAASDATQVSGEHTETALSGRVPLQVPGFKAAIMPAIVQALEQWKAEAERMATMLVDMERSYITAGFFRYTMNRRLQAVKAAQVTAGKPSPGSKSSFSKFKFMKSKADKADDLDDLEPPPRTASKSSGGAPGMAGLPGLDANDYLAAYFDKKVNDDSARVSLPMDSWRYQKRFFILSDSQRALYYFKSPDDVPKTNGLRGQINMAECMVEDLDDRGLPRAWTAKSPADLGRDDKLLLRIRHKDPRRSIVKEHNHMVLRADSPQTKFEWINRMMQVCAGTVPPAKQQDKDKDPSSNGSAPRRTNTDEAPAANGAAGRNANLDNLDDDDESLGGEVGAAPGEAVPGMQSAEEFSESRLGEGAPIFRAEQFRGDDGKLLPAPVITVNAANAARTVSMMSKMMQKAGIAPDGYEARYDAIIEQFGTDMCIYMRMVCDTVVTTVPKSVVHCLVRKAEKNLLNHMFTHVHKMPEEQLKSLLKEDEDKVQRRAMARQYLDDVRMAISDVQYMQEKLNRSEEKGDKITIKALYLALAGMSEQLTREQNSQFGHILNSPFAEELSSRAPVPLSHLDRPSKLPAGGAVAKEAEARKSTPALSTKSAAPVAASKLSASADGSLMQMGKSIVRRVSGSGSSTPTAAANGGVALRRPPPPPPGGR